MNTTASPTPANENSITVTGRILVVDDQPVIAKIHGGMLSGNFDVTCVNSGLEALKACASQMPDLVLLDIEMPGLDGFETCRKLRESTNIPILFATGHDSVEIHMKAFAAGGSDIFVKPVSAEILLFKVRRAILRYREHEAVKSERTELNAMARDFMASLDESATLLQFTRASLGSRSLDDLAQNFTRAAQAYGVACGLIIRQGGEETFGSTRGSLTSLERVALAHCKPQGRHFRFKNYLGINTPSISVIIADAPDIGTEAEHRLRDTMTALADTAEVLVENVCMRRESNARAEQMQIVLANTIKTVNQLREGQRTMVVDVRMTLAKLSDDMEDTFSWLATDRNQEEQISRTFNDSIEQILQSLLKTTQFEESFEQIITQLQGKSGGNELELF